MCTYAGIGFHQSPENDHGGIGMIGNLWDLQNPHDREYGRYQTQEKGKSQRVLLSLPDPKTHHHGNREKEDSEITQNGECRVAIVERQDWNTGPWRFGTPSLADGTTIENQSANNGHARGHTERQDAPDGDAISSFIGVAEIPQIRETEGNLETTDSHVIDGTT